MQSTIYKMLWHGKQKWLVLVSLMAVSMFYLAYLSIFGDSLCPNKSANCESFWLHSFGKPLFGGFLLKSMMIAPILLLPFSQMTFKVWAIMSAVYLPIAFYRVIFVAPIIATYFDKMAESNILGEVYLALTVAIIIVVSVGEFVWKKVKR